MDAHPRYLPNDQSLIPEPEPVAVEETKNTQEPISSEEQRNQE